MLLGPHAELVGEAVRVVEQVALEHLDVSTAILGRSHRVDEHAEPAQAEIAEEALRERDHLDVDIGIVDAEHLGAELPVLAVSPLLRALVAEVRGDVPDLPRGCGPVLDVGPHDRRGPFGAEREPTIPPIGELVHLLADDLGRCADALEDLDVLEDRRDHEAVAEPRRPIGESRDGVGPPVRVRRQHIMGPDRRAVPGSIGVGHPASVEEALPRPAEPSPPSRLYARAAAPGRTRYAS